MTAATDPNARRHCFDHPTWQEGCASCRLHHTLLGPVDAADPLVPSRKKEKPTTAETREILSRYGLTDLVKFVMLEVALESQGPFTFESTGVIAGKDVKVTVRVRRPRKPKGTRA